MTSTTTAPVARETVKLAALHDATYNPRRISDASRQRLSASLRRFGLVQEIVVNRRSAAKGWAKDERVPTIVGGHQRAQALRDSGVEDVPVCWVDLDERDEKALNVTLNNPHLTGEWADNLVEILGELSFDDGEDFGLAALSDEIGPLLEEGAMHVPTGGDEDPSPNDEPQEIECPFCKKAFKP